MEDGVIKPCSKQLASYMEEGEEINRGTIYKIQGYWWASLSCCLQKGNISVITRRYFKALELKYGGQFKMRKFGIKQILQQ